MARREEATPETNPREDERDGGAAPSVKEPSDVDRKLEGDQEALQPDSS